MADTKEKTTAAEPVPSEPAERLPLIETNNLGIAYKLSKRKAPGSIKGVLGNLFRREERDTLWALKNVNIQCHEGQIVGVVGHNGAGKSTLCLTISEILTPDEGEITVRGDVSTLISLGTGFNKDLSGRANLRIYASFLGIPEKELNEKMDEIIEFTELGDMIDEPIGHYSTGMKARLAFSVATSLDPDILVLDEILSVGDRNFREKSQLRIQEMMKKSRLIIIVSHSLPLIRNLCTHAVWIDHGEVQMHDTAENVIDAYEEHLDKIGGIPEKERKMKLSKLDLDFEPDTGM